MFAPFAFETGKHTMSELTNGSTTRADELFRQHRHQIYRETDRVFVWLMIAQWFAAVLAAIVVTPTTWAGELSAVHAHVWVSIFLGGAITVFPVWLTRAWPGAAITRHVIAAAQMLMSGLLISVTGGRIETHFHVFGSLVILSFYRDWRVLIPATLIVGIDHFVRGIYWPYSVYGVLAASPWRSIEHTAWVVFEDIFLVISCCRSVSEMRSIANRTAALEASEENFREIFEEAPIGIAVVGLDEKFRQANAKLCQMLDYSEEELLSRTPLDVTYPADLRLSRNLAQQMLENTSAHHLEKRYQRKNGEVVWATRTGCVIRDDAGTPRHFLIMIEDISERKRSDEALRKSKHELEQALEAIQLMMDNSQDVICTIDGEGKFVSINPACVDLWGYTPNELIGRSYVDLVHPDDRPKTAEADANIRKAGRLADFVNRYVRKDGTVVDVLWSASWSEADNRFFCVAHDVTQRQRTEEALREATKAADLANRAKSEFLSRMSHELRTPLNAILGFGQLLERQNPTATQRERLAHIINAGRHLLDLINEVLDISRIEAGRMHLSVEAVRLADVLSETLDLIRPLAAEREIELCAPDKIDNDWHVLADRQRFKQVLLNIFSNAVKYTPVKGRVAVSADSLGADRLRVVVSDNGPGIARENLSRLFTPFDRLGADQSSVQGTGLGLALSRRLMEAMRGTIGVESDLGRGSTFWVELPRSTSPLERVTAPAAAPLEPKPDPGATSPRGKRVVLYIEDNASNLRLIEQIMAEQHDAELITAMEGRLGVDLARKHLPQLILLDLHLPDIPGWEVLGRLKADATTRNIPVVVISADATAGQIKKLLSTGASAYLTKPLDIDQFMSAFDKFAQPVGEGQQIATAAGVIS
jgi:two-component system, sensor histidine kinase and response regulator